MGQLTTHQKNIILRGIANGAALRDKTPHLDNGSITTSHNLTIWDICSISTDAIAFGLHAVFRYQDGQTIIIFE